MISVGNSFSGCREGLRQRCQTVIEDNPQSAETVLRSVAPYELREPEKKATAAVSHRSYGTSDPSTPYSAKSMADSR